MDVRGEMTGAVDLAVVWPEVAAQLRGRLRPRNLSRDDLDELIQEVALRAVERPVPFGSVEDLRGWSLAVARNLATDWYRRRRRRQPRQEPLEADVASAVDVPRLVEHRLALAAITEAWPSFTPKQREAMDALFGGEKPRSRHETVAWSNRRNRVRERLRYLTGGAPAMLGGAWRWTHERAARVLGALDPRLLGSSAVSVATTTASLSIVALVGVATGSSPPASPLTETRPHRVEVVAPQPSPASPSSATPDSGATVARTTGPEGAAGVVPFARSEAYTTDSGAGERWAVEPPPADQALVPSESDHPLVPSIGIECPEGDRFIVAVVACAAVGASQSGGQSMQKK